MRDELQIPGRRIRELRKKSGLSLREVGNRCDMDYTTVGRVERGLGYTEFSLKKIADVLECDVTDFFLPNQLSNFSKLSGEQKMMIAKLINDLARSNNTTP